MKDHPAAKYRATPYEAIPLVAGTWALYVFECKKHIIVPNVVKVILDHCHVVAPIEDHEKHIFEVLKIPPTDENTIRNTLGQLVCGGLLVPMSAFLPTVPQCVRKAQTISCLGILTCDRPSLLQRALHSYTRYLDTFGRRPEIIIVDDSRARETSIDCVTIAGASPLRKLTRFAGRGEKEAYIGHLIHEGISPRVARFTILGDPGNSATYGANRNSLLLETIGSNVLAVDEDTIARIATHPNRAHQLRFANHDIPRDLWAYENREELEKRAKWSPDCDLFAEHETVLGRELADLITATLDQQNLDICDHLAVGLRKGARVSATISGVAGDSGAISGRLFLLWKKLLTASITETEFRQIMNSREVLWVSQAHTVTHSAFCQAMAIGLANWHNLPPFLPIGRNEDGVFGLLLAGSDKPSFLAHIPVAICHDPSQARRYDEFVPYRMSEVIIGLIAEIIARGLGPIKIAVVGQELVEIGDLPEPEFRMLVTRIAAKQKIASLRMLDSVVRDSPDCPKYWRDAVTEVYEHCHEELAGGEGRVFAELGNDSNGNRAMAWRNAQNRVSLMGELLVSWLDMRKAASDLRARDIRMSRAVSCN